jgi:hypothetical protein
MPDACNRFAGGTQLAIIPADPAAATPTLEDGHYSSVTYQVTPARYVSYSLTASGTVQPDTLLLPVLPGASTKAALSLEASHDGGRTIRLTASTGRLEGYWFRAPDDGTTRRVGPYRFDGSMAYTDHREGVQRILLTGGTRLNHGKNTTLLAADQALSSTLAVRLDQAHRTIEVSGPAAKPGGGSLHLAAPWARTATVAGQATALARHGDLVTVAALQ